MRRHCSSLSLFLVVVFMPRADKGNSHPLSGLPLFQLYLHFSPYKERIGSHCLSRAKGKHCEELCRVPGDHTGGWMFYVSVAFEHCRYHRCCSYRRCAFRTSWDLELFPQRTGTDFTSLWFGDEGKGSTNQPQKVILVAPQAVVGLGQKNLPSPYVSYFHWMPFITAPLMLLWQLAMLL